MKVAIITLGCRVNQYESEAVGEALEKMGYEVVYDFCVADKYILDTCAVTNEAERKSRQTVGKMAKLNPNAEIYVCGCSSQHNPEQFANLPNVKFVCGTSNKLSIIENLGKRETKVEPLMPYYEDVSLMHSNKTRCYVKIQDGCNKFCSYCLIPYLRGRSRSRDIISILKEVESLQNDNRKEVVLTGIDVSDYRIDNKPALAELLNQLSRYKLRIHLSSMEPNLLTDDFIDRIKRMKNFCPHFHISMQSGCDSVLKRMNRHYTSGEYLAIVKKLKVAFPNCAITTDVIVGFPGETEHEFNETLSTIKKCEFADMHVFPYSLRSGTTVEKLMKIKPKEYFLINGGIVSKRLERLQQVAKESTAKFLKEQIGQKLEVVVEEKFEDYFVGHSQNYVKVYFKKPTQILNEIVVVEIKELFKDGVLGEAN